MGAKFFIYKDGLWLKLDTLSGRLEGCREKARFLYVSKGTLQVAKTSKVLRGLKTLAAGRRSTVRCGLQLSQKRRKKRRRPLVVHPPTPPQPAHCCTCVVRDSVAPVYPTISTQQPNKSITDAVTQTSLPEKPHNQPKPAATEQPMPSQRQTQVPPCRELFIDVEDLEYIRRILTENPSFMKNFDLHAFNNNDAYRNLILFNLNPLVKIAKIDISEHVKRDSDEIDVKQFAAMLGLTHVTESTPHKYTYKTRKQVENITNSYERHRMRKRIIQISSTKDDDDKENDGRNPKTREIYDSSTESDLSATNKRNDRVNLRKIKSNAVKYPILSDTSTGSDNSGSKIEGSRKRKGNKSSSDEVFVKQKSLSNRNVRSTQVDAGTNNIGDLNGVQSKTKSMNKEKPASTKQSNNSITDAVTLTSPPEKPDNQPKPAATEQPKTSQPQTLDPPYRELSIDVDDLEYIRRILTENPSFIKNFNSHAFDNNDVYRNLILFKLNPLVKIAKIDISKHVKRDSDAIDVKQFAAMLGLIPVTESTSPKYTYKTRKQVENITNSYERHRMRKHIQISTTKDDYNKENDGRNPKTREINDSSTESDLSATNKRNDRVNLRKIKSDAVKYPILSDTSTGSVSKLEGTRKRKGIESSTDEVFVKENYLSNRNVRSTQADAETSNIGELNGGQSNIKSMNKEKQASNGVFEKKMLPLQTRIKAKLMSKMTENVSSNSATSFRSANGRDYSSLEDHAIVAWVGNGGRERKVNGNTIWRELQSEYHNITGINRSWHSLRNRYLRYILPSLAKLCLEPALQSKLRAAAVKGELKLARKRSLNKHNSLLVNKPVQSAWAKRPKSPEKRPTSSEERPKSLEKRPKSPEKRPTSPEKRSSSPEKRTNSPREMATSPSKQLRSADKKSLSLRRHIVSHKEEVPTISEEVNNTSRSLRSSMTPTYESITRKFTEFRRLRERNSFGSDKIMSHSTPELKSTRSRKLFNPNAVNF